MLYTSVSVFINNRSRSIFRIMLWSVLCVVVFDDIETCDQAVLALITFPSMYLFTFVICVNVVTYMSSTGLYTW